MNYVKNWGTERTKNLNKKSQKNYKFFSDKFFLKNVTTRKKHKANLKTLKIHIEKTRVAEDSTRKNYFEKKEKHIQKILTFFSKKQGIRNNQ